MAKIISQLPSGGALPKHNDLQGLNEDNYIHLTQLEKANLDNQSGINTGDETTFSIQTKRPLKTVDNKSLEGIGNIEIDYNTVINKPTSFPPSIHTHIVSEITDFPTFKTIENQSIVGTGNIDLNKSDVGLGNVDNTSDLNKPISTATQLALDDKLDENISLYPSATTPLTGNEKVILNDGTGWKQTEISDINSGQTFKPYKFDYTGGLQVFTPPNGISQVLLVFVQGQMWDEIVQFTYNTTTVTITDTLPNPCTVSIIYSESPVSALPFYTRAEENTLFETKKPRLVYVNTKQDFIDHGSKTGNVITLDENVNFHLINNVDLDGDRLVCSYNTIFDHLATNASLKSTGLGDEYLITVNNTCRFDNFLLEGNSANDGIYVNNLTATIAINQLVMQNFKFGLEVINANNVLIDKSNFVNSNVKIFNSVGYFGMNESILLSTVSSVGYLLEFKNTAVLVDRAVLYRNSFVNSAGVTGLILDNAVTCGAEKLQLIYNRFSGAGANKITGINSIDTRADFKNNEGIKNGAIIGNYYNINNATATDIVTTNVPVKVNSTATTADSITNKFTHTNNRLTYIGSFEKDFVLNATASVTGTNGHNLAFQFAKNGTVIASTYQPISIGASNRAENVKILGAISLAPNDYIELWVRNVNNNNDVTVTSYSVLVESKN